MTSIPVSHLIFELVVYALMILCLFHTRKQKPQYMLLLFAAVLYGILIEMMGLGLRVTPNQNYHYGKFIIMLFGELPLSVPVGWSVIIYAAVKTTNRLGAAPWWQRPFVNGLLALLLDFVMDPVASGTGGLGLWHWSASTDTFWWMDVPVTNFIGWYTVIVSFTFFTALAWRLWPPQGKGLLINAGIFLGVVAASLLTNTLILFIYKDFMWEKVWEPIYFVGLLLISIMIFVWHARGYRRDHPLDIGVVIIPAFFLFYFYIAYLVTGMLNTLPEMFLNGLGLILLGLFLFLLPYQKSLFSLPSGSAEPPLTAGKSVDTVPGSILQRGWAWLVAYPLFVRLPAFGLTAMLPLLGAGTVVSRLPMGIFWGLLIVVLAYHQFGYVLNDIVDLPVDRRQPRRARYPLVQGMITPKQAMTFALLQIPIAFGLHLWLIGGAKATGLLALAFITGAMYNLWGKRTSTPILLDIIQGLAWVSLMLYGTAVTGQPESVTTWVLAGIIFLYIVLVNGVHASLRDLESDLEAGVQTTALNMGARPESNGFRITRPLAIYTLVLQLGITGLLIVPLWNGVLPYSSDIRIIITVVLSLLLVLCGWFTWRTLYPRTDVPITYPVMSYVIITLLSILLLFAPLMDLSFTLAVLAVYVLPMLVHDTFHNWLVTRFSGNVVSEGG